MNQLDLFLLPPKPAGGEDTKVCSRCRLALPLSAFGRHLQYDKDVYHACRACMREHDAAIRNFKDLGMYDIVLRRQGGHCGICPTPEDLCIDVDHATMRPRGLLCRKCNIMLGQLERVDAVVRYLLGYINGGNR